MSATQNGKIRQVTETIIVIGMNIASEAHWGRVFDWCDLEFGKGVKFENSAEGFIFFCAGYLSWQPNRRRTASW